MGTTSTAPSARYIAGDSDDVRVYNRRLHTSELLELYNAGLGDYPGAVGNDECNDADASIHP